MSKSNDAIDIVYDAGKIISFKKVGSVWKLSGKEDVPYKLKVDENSIYYLLDPSKELIYIFSGGRLVKIEDRNGNSLLIRYNKDLTLPVSIEDGLGRAISLVYDPKTSKLSKVCDWKDRCYIFEYEDNLLKSITYPDSTQDSPKKITFEYDTENSYKGLITKVIYPRGNYYYEQKYNDEAKVISQKDPFGNEISISYDEKERIISYPNGSSIKHLYKDGRFLTGVVRDENEVKFGYTNDGHRNNLIDQLGEKLELNYDTSSGKLSRLKRYGNVDVSYEYVTHTNVVKYNGEGQVSFEFKDLKKITVADEAYEISTDDKGNITKIVGPNGSFREYTYNDRGQVLSEKNPLSGVVTYEYNDDGTLKSIEDSDTEKVSYEYDDYKRLKKVIYPDGSYKEYEYDLLGHVTAYRDRLGNRFEYGYDANGNLIWVKDPNGDKTTYDYDEKDRLVKETDRDGSVVEYRYDSMDRIVKVITELGNIELSFDKNGDPIEFRDTTGRKLKFSYDKEGRPMKVTVPGGQKLSYELNAFGDIKSVVTPSGESGSVTTQFETDKFGRITKIRDPFDKEVNYTYSSDGNGIVNTIEISNLGKVTYRRNFLGLICEIKDLNGKVWKFDYTKMGRIKSVEDPLGNKWEFSYDNQGRKKNVKLPSGEGINYTYDANGNLIRADYQKGDETKSIEFAYDALGCPTQTEGLSIIYDKEGRVIETKNKVDDMNLSFLAEYDRGGRLIKVTYPGNLEVSYTYDENGRLKKVSDNMTDAFIEFSYDECGRVSEIKRSNGIDTKISWDNLWRITSLKEGNLASFDFDYDEGGKLISQTATLPMSPNDFLDNLDNQFSYDDSDRIVNDGFLVDESGKVLKTPWNKFVWDAAGRLSKIDDLQLYYNGYNDLVKESFQGKTTYYFYNYAITLTPVVAESNTPSDISRYYVWTPEGNLLYMIDKKDGQKVYFYHFNLRGDTIFLTDKEGNVTDRYAYRPYGKLLKHEGNISQPFTFVGKYGVRNEHGSIYYMRSRYYDANLGRFLSFDPLWPAVLDPLALNPYVYAALNPQTVLDPTGESWGKTAKGLFKFLKSQFKKETVWGDMLKPSKMLMVGGGYNLVKGNSLFDVLVSYIPGASAKGEGTDKIMGQAFSDIMVGAPVAVFQVPADIATDLIELDFDPWVTGNPSVDLAVKLYRASGASRRSVLKFILQTDKKFFDRVLLELQNIKSRGMKEYFRSVVQPMARKRWEALHPYRATASSFTRGVSNVCSGIASGVKKVASWIYYPIGKAADDLGIKKLGKFIGRGVGNILYYKTEAYYRMPPSERDKPSVQTTPPGWAIRTLHY